MQSVPSGGTNAFRAIRVFLASPGDLGLERQAARAAVDEINRTVARPAGYHVDLVGWEDTLSSIGRPQALINEELDTCELFIGLIWQRWGTPPDVGGPYTSGFEEEYLRSRERHKRTNSPLMRLFFKDVDAGKTDDAGPELQKVLDFKKSVINEKAVLFQTFDVPASFAQHVRIGLADYINRLADSEKGDQKRTVGASSPPSGQTGVDADQPSSGSAGSASEVALLERLAASLKSKDDEIDATAVARVRNLAIALGGHSNDQTSLGAHDANLLYRDKANLKLSSREIVSLADAGLDSLPSENAPLWWWLSNRLKAFPDWLLFSTLIGPDERRLNAFKVAMMIGAKLETNGEHVTKADLIRMWFADTSDRLKNAALEFLGSTGTSTDADAIRKELSHSNYGTKGTAQRALLTLLGREDSQEAAKFLLGSNINSLDATHLDIIKPILSQLTTDRLFEGLENSSPIVRRIAMGLLSSRDALTSDTLIKLLEDDSLEIRNDALTNLEGRGHVITEKQAEAFLIRKRNRSALSVGSSGEEGREAFNDYKTRQLLKLSVAQLEALREPFGSDKIYFALCKKQIKAKLPDLREKFDDRFDAFYYSYGNSIKHDIGKSPSSDVLNKMISDNETFWKRNWMRDALDILVSKSDKQDIDRVRKALDEDVVDPRRSDIQFLKKHGSFADIPRICAIDADYRSNSGSTILGYARDRRSTALAVLSLGKDNITNILASDLPEDMIPSIISVCKANMFKELSTPQIDNLLYHDSDKVRKSAALKLLATHDLKSVSRILDRYLTADRPIFYNVIFWLDLKSSLPSAVVKEVSSTELSNID